MSVTNLIQDDEGLRNFHYAIQITVLLLKPIGAWPLDPQASILEIIMQRILIVIAIFVQLFMIVPWIICLVKADLDFYEISRTMCPLIFCSTLFLRYLLLLFYQNEIRSCVDRIGEDWRNTVKVEDREIMLKNAKYGRMFGIMSMAFMYGCGIPYCIKPLILGPEIQIGNASRALPNPSELLVFDSQVSPVYEVTYILECFSACVIYTVFCGICSLTAKLVSHVCGQCDILMSLFENLTETYDKDHSTIDQKISNAIIHHLRIIRFVSDVDKMMNEICLAEFINASCNICLLGYYIITDWNNGESMLQLFVYSLALVSVTFNTYIFCHLGEQLVESCQKIGTACYTIEWYRLPYTKARSLIFPMIMSNYPLELTAGKLLAMTMNSFSNIMKTSMMYFNLLREMSTIEAIT